MEHSEYQTGTIECIQLDEGEYLWRWMDGDQIAMTDAFLNGSPFVVWDKKNPKRFKMGPFTCEIEHEWPDLEYFGVKIVSKRATKQHAIERRVDRQVVLSGGTSEEESAEAE